jgi:hypothetical protein
LVSSVELLFPACGGHPAPNDVPTGNPFAACGSFSNPNLPPSTSAAGGTFSSPLFNAVMCPGAAWAQIIPNTPNLMSTIDSPYFFVLTTPHFAFGMQATTGFLIQSPPHTVNVGLDVEVALPAPAPGTYEGVCGIVTTDLAYGPPGLDCSGDAGTTCPMGCTRRCATPPCPGVPCTPNSLEQEGWMAATGSSCGDGFPTPRGTWTLTLTSATEQDVSPGQVAYVPHGTFTATMPEYPAMTSPPLSVWLTF